MRLRWTAGLLLLVVPTVSAASVPTDLFFHVISVQDMPINTQAPADDYADDAGYGPGATLRCLDATTGDIGGAGVGTGGTTNQAFQTYRGYSTPSLVDYAHLSDNGMPRTRPSRGLWGNATIDADAPMQLHWFLRASSGADLPAPAAPNVLVRAVIRSGDQISVDDQAYDEGRLLFDGEAGPVTLTNGQVFASPDARGEVRAAKQVGQDWVYEVIIPLQAAEPILPMEGFNVRVDVLMEAPGCESSDASLMPNILVAHSSAGARPRVAWSVVDPLLEPEAALALGEDGNVTTHVRMATVFGDYDISNVSVKLTKHGRGGPVDIPLQSHLVQGYGPCGHDCGHTFEVHYLPEAGARGPGRYVLAVSFDNLQGGAHGNASAELIIEPSAEAPAPAVPFLLAGLLALAIACRRR